MNEVLQLKGEFDKRSNHSGEGVPIPTIKTSDVVTSSHVDRLAEALESVYEYWRTRQELNGSLVNVTYKRVIPKSSRISKLFTSNNCDSIKSICGSKFGMVHDESGRRITRHIFTHFLKLKVLEKAVQDLRAVSKVIAKSYGGSINHRKFGEIGKDTYECSSIISRSRFRGIVADVVEIVDFQVASPDALLKDESIVTLYHVETETKELLKKYGITVTDDRIINETTVKLYPHEVELLQRKAPFLIAMSVHNIRDLADEYDDEESDYVEPALIPPPSEEPIIGVIDTAFDNDRAYFREWVEYHDMIPKGVIVRDEDKRHGTAISSIIVDGVKGNPDLEDHCGRFRVRHFGVLAGNRIDSFDFMRKVQEIVATNLDIKVWNISCGSEMEINSNFISPEGALLDYLQRVYDIVFIVAGTNVPKGHTGEHMRIGSPADSLNAIVVNATNLAGEAASYTREGPVLSFFIKPDVCYYGGEAERDQRIVVNEGGMFASGAYGTSVAAPWIARKMAYLMHIMGLPREIAKALIIDSAAGWRLSADSKRMGYGLVPKSIRDILSTRDDEIRFFIRGTTLAYETYTTSLPVPATSKGHPFLARATMVYYPWCERNHGVDYTNTEMTLKFGRVRPGQNPGEDKIESLDGDRQGEVASLGNSESEARKIYRKWDNVKRIADKFTEHGHYRKPYNSKNLWGISVVTKERGVQKNGIGLPFGIVVTLREINGDNRIEEFIQGCRYRSWMVTRLNPDIHLRNYLSAHSDMTLR